MDQATLDKLIETPKINQRPSESVKVDKRLANYIARYEKLRNIVGFHDEHLWRRFAIRRILKRQLLVSSRTRASARDLLSELVLAQYIREEDVSEEAVAKVETVIDKYLASVDFFQIDSPSSRRETQNWFFGILAIEIEEILGFLAHQEALLEAMTKEMNEQLEFPRYYLEGGQEEIFILIATSEALLKADPEFIAYMLIKKWYPEWFKSDQAASMLVHQVWDLRGMIDQYQKHPAYKQITRLAKKQAVIFWVLDEVIKKFQGDVTDISFKAFTVVRQIYYKLQKKVKGQVWRSFIYLAITKFSLILILELPYDLWRTGQLHKMQPMVTLGVPLFLLVVLTIGVQVGNQANTKVIVKEVDNLLKGNKSELDLKVKMPAPRSILRSMVFNFIFTIVYAGSYGGMIYLLQRYHFNPVSTFLVVLYVTIVSYMAIRIRFTAERFRILKRKKGVGREVIYFFSLPILWTGRWLSKKFSQYNLLLLFFDLFFEAPFKTLVFVFRDFSDFAREMREGIE